MQLQRVGNVSSNSNKPLNDSETMASKGMNSPVLYNRSFLHGDVIRKKHETLDSLALRRTSFPLQLVPTDIVIIDKNIEDTDDILSIDSCQIDASTERQSSFKEQSNNGEEYDRDARITSVLNSVDDIANKEDVDTQVPKDLADLRVKSETKLECELTRSKRRSPSSADGGKLVVKPKWIFTSTMMHYVPKKNFVHVAGNRRWSWLQDVDLNTQTKVITHEEKCAILTLIGEKQDKENICERSSSVETPVYEPVEKSVNESTVSLPESSNQPEELVKINSESQVYSSKPRANVSFLWSNIAKCSSDEKNLENSKNEYNCADNHEYDDVGPSQQIPDETYDDVGVPKAYGNGIFSVKYQEEVREDDEQVYDDVIPSNIPIPLLKMEVTEKESTKTEILKNLEVVPISLKKNNSAEKTVDTEDGFIYVTNDAYSTIGEDTNEEDAVYDDVGILYESRVNSIYAGSVDIFSLDPTKESEWEDLEECSLLNGVSKNNVQLSLKSITESQAVVNKKKSGQRRARKVRRQRSKASRRNSARSANRLSRQSTISDTCSDDSNYETLYSFEANHQNDMESGVKSWSENSTEVVSRNRIPMEAPARPVPPPPPRESNLSGTIGRRMQILKRTWSITKGSLGRMRRKASTDIESNVDDNGKSLNLDHHTDGRKGSQVFNFKKHFQRNTIGTSTFYLDNGCDNNMITSNNSLDEIYQNSNWSINSNYSSAQENSSENDYNMLAGEPLYQFYAASTFRGAFQSDSDSYGDTDDSISLPATSELGKPGQRTLWSQTPQVIKSGLLERLTPDEKKIQEAKFEIITSEASYLNSLRVLVNEFLINHELVYDALSPTDREKLFGNVPSVLIASERFLAELESVWKADPMLPGLPDALLKHAEGCSKIYIEYCSNQVSIDLTLKELRSKKSSKFIETVTRIESHPACQNLSLHSFLMLPMQRVTRLPLLADAVLSKLSTDHEERLNWEKVLSVLSKVVTDCNEGARIAGRLIEMKMLAKKLEYSVKVPPIDLRDRYLVRSGPVTQICAKPGADYVLTFRKKYNKTPLYLLLMTDHLLVTKLKSNAQDEIYFVIDSCRRSVVALEKVPDDSPFAGRHAMILTLLENYCGRHVEYILSCQNATERERWLDAVSPPKPSLVGETLYETWDCPQVMALYSYTPVQPDELSLQPGDVINVLRKMADGWNLGEKLVGGEQGWFPGNYTKEVASEHVRARNLRQRHRLLALSESFLLHYAKQTVR
ncbi:uncharacterized protein Exn isoform X2 [Chelonus insularis]|uniref:uncharacterized protein Exn isoform X2 n=1 Tax=Chelonus insularis TaxID=460826 RepID=UPI00158C1246|nr:uncharacterized protein LOC118067905 isoform X2 [Chelonus insularis]